MLFLKKSYHYNAIYKRHKRIKSDHFTLLYQQKESEPGPAFGIVVRKKVGKAVTRNKIKRRVRAFLRSSGNQIQPKIKGVIIAGDDAGQINWQETKNDLNRCLKLAGAYN